MALRHLCRTAFWSRVQQGPLWHLTETTCSTSATRGFAADSASAREQMTYDVCIVGAGPAGLSAAIKLKQLCKEKEKELSVCVIEKASEVGAHILSGNVFEPRALDELFPEWKQMEGVPITVAAKKDYFYMLTQRGKIRLPNPPQMHNKGNYVISLSELTRWLAARAEELGVEIYPGFAGKQVLYDWHGAVVGVGTNDFGIAKDGSRKSGYTPGVDLLARATLLAEGARGSLSQQVMTRYQLREAANAAPQTYALGIKEVWELPEGNNRHKPGTIYHTVGYPLDQSTYGGGFLYHMSDNRIALGLVVALDYANPYLNTYQEFQRWKAHPLIAAQLEGGSCVQYGARVINEGGVQSVPRLDFPGGALIGCSAGFVNVPKIKGTHTAMKSGIMAAESAFYALTETAEARAEAAERQRKLLGVKASTGSDQSSSKALDLAMYDRALRHSWVWDELERVRNIRPGFKHGLLLGMANAALDTYLLRGRAPWTLRHARPDHEALEPASRHTPIDYPKPDGKVTFDLPTSLYRSGTNHEHDQPAHLQLLNEGLPEVVNLPVYNGPETRYCPAGVYEYQTDQHGRPRLRINAQNCLHCKACSIKDPRQNIRWTVPEGGGGPGYTVM